MPAEDVCRISHLLVNLGVAEFQCLALSEKQMQNASRTVQIQPLNNDEYYVHTLI